MPRVGISKAVVQTARDALLARGVHPSVDAIRVELGNTGSNTTIQRYLKELATPNLPMAVTTLRDDLVHYVEMVAMRLIEETRQQVASEQPQLDEAWQQPPSTEAQNRELITDLQKQLADQRTAMENLTQQKRNLEHQCVALQQLLSQRESANHALSERNDHLEALLDQECEQPPLQCVPKHQHNEQRNHQLKEKELQNLKATLLQTQTELIALYREQRRSLAESQSKNPQTRPDDQRTQPGKDDWDQQA
ncbi:DNA-binding protein [Pseudomonas pudica]|uniref:DNA-binding protein n=1 Tax=Pseudomonas pudica TaxID=272772 RepID=A0ABS0FUV7_9PSED|nr:DNA-binding protein [Pseudomonas pudica]MBF8644066.1 DNA-binding protein [Pseudomonas pudica]MBF8758567.1 DNA-binding protein [Pseudomonas pudica]